MAEKTDEHRVPDAGKPVVSVSALEHPMVLAGLARMASSGAWQHIIDQRRLTASIDLADAELLVAAGALARAGDDTYRLAVNEPLYRNPQAVADSARYMLGRAMNHASGRTMSWANEDPETIQAFGRTTGHGADLIADELLPRLPTIETTFRTGSAAFLDVGVGIAAISIRLLQRFPGTHAVGLDVLTDVLEVARAEVARSGLANSIELRLQSIADLHDQDRYDLAWVPQGFIPRAAFVNGIHNVFDALKPGGAMLVPVALHPDTSEFARARLIHSAHLAGGSTINPSELVELLQATGFTELAEHPVAAQVLMTATKPRPATATTNTPRDHSRS